MNGREGRKSGPPLKVKIAPGADIADVVVADTEANLQPSIGLDISSMAVAPEWAHINTTKQGIPDEARRILVLVSVSPHRDDGDFITLCRFRAEYRHYPQ